MEQYLAMEHRKQRHIRLLLSSLVAFVAVQMQANAIHLPRLVVCISVDELREDYLRHLEPMMQEGGFRRMLRAGKIYPQVTFPFRPLERTGAIASIHSGVYPEAHGFSSALSYNRGTHSIVHRLWDDAVQGVYTREQYSPRALRVATFADRLKDASEGASLVYSVGVNAEDAIIAGGAMPDGCFWLDSRIASWASSSYYPKMPSYIDRYNRSDDGPNKRLISGLMQWRPLRKYEDHPTCYASWSRGFDYIYQGHEATRYKQSPLAGEEVTRLALKLIEHGGYQQRKSPGLLALSYSLASNSRGELSAEDVDRYLRLDQDLGRLFEALERHIGLEHCLLVLSGTGHVSYTKPSSSSRGKEFRELSLGQTKALVNMYLSASYGPGNWIDQIYGNRIYLNRQLIEEKKLDLATLQGKVAGLWREIKGVGLAYAASNIREGFGGNALSLWISSVPRDDDADVYWDLLPGWNIKEQTEHPELERRTSGAIRSPLLLFGAGVDPTTFDYPVRECSDIVRAVCWVLRIRPPNDVR
ncbi:MAG: alkaline phosphatase family protein [Porphyromonadaceae bacterium]|nr:alkaline phosphatase family protein [Porphyromonadaceae bacterium]